MSHGRDVAVPALGLPIRDQEATVISYQTFLVHRSTLRSRATVGSSDLGFEGLRKRILILKPFDQRPNITSSHRKLWALLDQRLAATGHCGRSWMQAEAARARGRERSQENFSASVSSGGNCSGFARDTGPARCPARTVMVGMQKFSTKSL